MDVFVGFPLSLSLFLSLSLSLLPPELDPSRHLDYLTERDAGDGLLRGGESARQRVCVPETERTSYDELI